MSEKYSIDRLGWMDVKATKVNLHQYMEDDVEYWSASIMFIIEDGTPEGHPFFMSTGIVFEDYISSAKMAVFVAHQISGKTISIVHKFDKKGAKIGEFNVNDTLNETDFPEFEKDLDSTPNRVLH